MARVDTRINKKRGKLSVYRRQVSKLANYTNELLREARAENLSFLRKKWNAILEETGTKKTKEFRRTTSSMNTAQLQEYAQRLTQFEKEYNADVKSRHKIEELVGKGFYVDMWEEIKDQVETELYRYFIPSKEEHDQMVNAIQTAVNTMTNSDEALQTLGARGIVQNIFSLIKMYGLDENNQVIHTGQYFANHIDLISAIEEMTDRYYPF